MSELDELRKFINEALDVLRRRYNSTIHGFDSNWERLTLKKKRDGETDVSTDVRTIYGTFVDELTKFEAMPMEAASAEENGSVKFKKHLLLLRRLNRLANGFPDTGSRDTQRLALAIINYYEYSNGYFYIRNI